MNTLSSSRPTGTNLRPALRLLGALALLTVVGAPALHAQAAPAAANSAAVPTLRNDWLTRHEKFNAIAKQGGVNLLFVGDSITDFWGSGSRGKPIWDKRYAPLKAANFGISGDRTEHVLWRLQNGNLDGIQPKVVVLMIGTNNLPADNTPAQIAEGVAAILKEIHTRCPASKVLLLGVFPRGEKANNPARAPIAEINRLIGKFDDGKQVHFLDIGAKFLTPDGTLTKEIMADALHPGLAGYQIWADAMQPKLDELLK
jgi:lysophospholipase L1-like esterase